jgi:hypothetical protein
MKRFAVIFCIILVPLMGKADIIHFKDGMKTVCQEKAWEENQEVKCEYEGTVISYQKKDVLRIQKIRTEKNIETGSKLKLSPAKPAARQNKPGPDAKSPAAEKKSINTKGSKPVTVKSISSPKTNGLEFYNPRRPDKYWTSASSKHKTFEQAIGALAKQYDRSPEWITQQMGETNNLDEIHQNLRRSKTNISATPEKQNKKTTSGILFYNPRRPNKYWSSATAKHKTYKEAISALAATYERTPEWVQQNMGESNNLKEIHQKLKTKKSSETPQ